MKKKASLSIDFILGEEWFKRKQVTTYKPKKNGR